MRAGTRFFPSVIARLLMFGAVLAGLTLSAPWSQAQGLVSSDLYRFRAVGQVALSPDNHRIAYTVTMYDRPGRPYSQIWIMDLSTAASTRLGGEKEASSNPLWSPDGKWLSYSAGEGDKSGLWVAHADGSGATFLAPTSGTNSPLPEQGESVTWSPDSKQIAFVSSTPGPETAEASGDPMVITRYLYKPTASEGLSHFNDNRRLHIFTVDVATHQVRQLTQGTNDEHSIDWSPDGKEILFVSNHEPNADEFFNYDIFALKVADGSVRRLTATESLEIRSALVTRWKADYLLGQPARPYRPRNQHGRLARVADGCRRIAPARGERDDRQPPGPPPLVAGRERGLFHRAGTRQRPPGAPADLRLRSSQASRKQVVNELGAVGGFSVGPGRSGGLCPRHSAGHGGALSEDRQTARRGD